MRCLVLSLAAALQVRELELTLEDVEGKGRSDRETTLAAMQVCCPRSSPSHSLLANTTVIVVHRGSSAHSAGVVPARLLDLPHF